MTGSAAPRSVGFGFLGAGAIATRALRPAVEAAEGAHLAAVAARDEARAAALEPAGRAYGDYAALLADESVEVVYVSLHNAGHAPWVTAALEAGKHVLCEKPLGLDPAEVAAMRATAERTDRLLVEAFWYRWHPRTRRLEQLLRQGALGPVRRVDADFSFAGPGDGDPDAVFRLDPARGGGALYDVGCYALSAAHLALGPVLEVDGVEPRLGSTGVDLALTARLRQPGADGAVAEIRCGIAAPDRQQLRVEGQGATVEFVEAPFTSLNWGSSLLLTTPDRGRRVEEFAPVDPYALMVRAVAARVRGEEAFLVDLDHSQQIAATIAAIRETYAESNS